jgi:hypothetical protein
MPGLAFPQVPTSPAARAIALVLTVASLNACATVVTDLTVSQVTQVDSVDIGRGAGIRRDLYRINLRTRANLAEIRRRWDAFPHAAAYFCNDPGDFSVLDLSIIYATDPTNTYHASAAPPPSELRPTKQSVFEYIALLNVERPAPYPSGRAVEKGAEGICIKLEGGYMWYKIISNTARIPGSVIGSAAAIY